METKASPILEEPKEVLPLAPEAASRQTTRHNLTSENVVAEQAADETWRLVQEHGATVGELTPEVERTLKRKIYLYVLVLVMVIDLMLYVRWHLATQCLLVRTRVVSKSLTYLLALN